ncbi:sigma-E processing peptidase SpoIIGA [Cohnella nanjingensis]|uniref:Sigma-E processing peptidase SpoIIGA n=1 Tax=Cohnella nanjingensis TaxID=1387779 RepID=A0A7X0RT54_9BACL|nr:sigma-E processing peptidase SpoIIGA [Cohnella nanjingensis]MBB6673212.1 sigma-E processing peptidase SpoIIGA [Cohnella nanjingensis]
MTVYVDLVFLSNLTMDAAVLLATAKARRLRPAKRRVAASATLGAAYAAAMFVATVPFLYTFGAKVGVSILMVLLAFGYGGPLRFARHLGSFYLASFAALGGMIGISSLLKYAGSPWELMEVTSSGSVAISFRMSAGLFAVTAAIAIWLYRGEKASVQSRDRLEALLADVSVRIDGQVWRCRGIVDTGNRLYDPLTRIPVMIMEAAVWRDQLPSGWADRLREEPADRLVSELDPSAPDGFAWSDRLRLVPYRGVNGSTRLMLAIKPDAVEIAVPGGNPLTHRRVLVGLDGGTLSAEGAYRAIVHADLTLADEQASAPSQTA